MTEQETRQASGTHPPDTPEALGALEAQLGTGPNLWTTLGYRLVSQERGGSLIEWAATEDYCFPTRGGPVVQGGMVTALLDAAMGRACWTVLGPDQVFLTADLRVEFLRAARPGTLRAGGSVVRRARQVVFCAADLHDETGALLASSRCTQVVLHADGAAGRANRTPLADA